MRGEVGEVGEGEVGEGVEGPGPGQDRVRLSGSGLERASRVKMRVKGRVRARMAL